MSSYFKSFISFKMISKQIFIFLFVIFSLVQLIICPPTLENDTTSVKSEVRSKNNEVPRTSQITTNKPFIQKTPLPQNSFVAAQAKAEPSGTFDAGARILTKPSGTASQTSKKLPRLSDPPVVDDKKTTAFSKNRTLLPITAAMPEITPSSPKPIVESLKTLSRTQHPQSSGAPAVTVPLKAPVASVPYKQSNLAPKTPAVLSVISPESVKIKASQPAEISPMVPRTLSKSIEAPVVVPQQKPVAPIKMLQQNPATLVALTQSNTSPKVPLTTSKLPSATPKIKVEPAKLSFVTSRSLSTPPAKPSGSVSRSPSLPSKQPFRSQKDLVSSPNVPVTSTRSVPTAHVPLKRTPSQNIMSTQPSKYNDDFPERKGTYDVDYNNVESSKGLKKQISKRIPEVIKRPINWASKPAKLAWKFANIIKNKVTGNNVAT